MYCTNFTFDGETSVEHGVIICNFDNSDGSTSVGSKIEMSTVKPPNSNKWYKTNSKYSEQLSIPFSICKKPCNEVVGEDGKTYTEEIDDMYFSEQDVVDVVTWLMRKDYKYLNFEQDGYEDVFYNCNISAEKVTFKGKIIGFNLTITCDAPFGWSSVKVFECEDTNTFTINSTSEEIGHIIPNVEITVLEDGDLTISNALTGKTIEINNCVENEVITITDMQQITSTENIFESDDYVGNHLTLMDDYNWEDFSISNTRLSGENIYTLSLNCNVSCTYREARKAVI